QFDSCGFETGGSENFHRRQRQSHHSRVAREVAPAQSAAGCATDHRRLFATAQIDISPGAGQSAAGNLRDFRGAERSSQGTENSDYRGGAIESTARAAFWRQTALERSARVRLD